MNHTRTTGTIPWAKLDNGIFEDTTLTSCGMAAQLMHIAAITYASKYLTDGVIPKTALRRVANPKDRTPGKSAAELVAAGVWADGGDAWVLPEWGVLQPSAAAVEARREKWRTARAESRRNAERMPEECRRNAERISEECGVSPAPAVTSTFTDLSAPDTHVVSGVLEVEVDVDKEKTYMSEPMTGDVVALSGARTSVTVNRVFDHWRTVMGHPHAKLDTKRRTRIQWAIKNYPIETVLAAIDGCKASPFHMGANDRGQIYDDLTLILRDATKLEMFAGRTLHPSTIQPTQRHLSSIERARIERTKADRLSEALQAEGCIGENFSILRMMQISDSLAAAGGGA